MDRVERRELMAALFRSGKTYQEVGDAFGITRQAVQQWLAPMGITKQDGGSVVACAQRAKERAEKRAAAQDVRCLERHGMPHAEYIAIPRKHRNAYRAQKQSAGYRGIEWRLSLREWLAVWTESGLLDRRGRAGDAYVMSRHGDVGPYAVGNVYIQRLRMNSKEGFAGANPAKQFRGVFCLYPGRPRPFLAKYSRVRIGYYATAEEAAMARDQWMQDHGVDLSRRARSVRVVAASLPHP